MWWKRKLEPQKADDPELRYAARVGPELYEQEIFSRTPKIAARPYEYSWVYARVQPGTRVFDVGCGNSDFPALLARKSTVSALDPVHSVVEHEQIAKKIGVNYTYTQGLLSSGNQDFDCVSCVSVIEHVEDDITFSTMLSSHLKSGGVLLLTAPYSHQQGAIDKSYHATQQRYYSMEDIHIRIVQPSGMIPVDMNFVKYTWPPTSSQYLSAPNDAGVFLMALRKP